MKTAIKVLVIIGIIIGIIWSFLGFFGSAIFAVIDQDKEAKYENVGVKSALALVAIILGLVFGIIASGKTAGKGTTIVMGVLLGGSGLIATILYSYVAGPIYILGGFLAIIAGLVQKQKLA